MNLPLCAPALWIVSILEYDHSNQTARLPLFSLQSAYRPTSQPASWFRFPHTTHPKAQRELARPASCHTARHPTIRSTGQYPSDQSLAIRPGNKQASDGLVNLWPPSQRHNNKNSIRRSRRPLAIHNKPNNMNSIKSLATLWQSTIQSIIRPTAAAASRTLNHLITTIP